MDKMPQGETLYKSSGSQSSQTSTPQGSSEQPQGASLIKLVRRVPRSWWLGSAIAVLLTASVSWYIRLQSWEVRHIPSGVDASFLSKQWWSEPVVSGADSALPEISGRLYGVAVQNNVTSGRGRVWVVGSGGFLAYSDEEGQCWTPYEYNSGTGEFREVSPNPCAGKRRSRLDWPELVPTVYAAEVKKSSASRPQATPAQVPSNARSTMQQTANSYSGAQPSRAGITVSPLEIDFGRVATPGDGKPAAYTKSVTVFNQTGTELQLYVKGFSGDTSGEFRQDAGSCDKGLRPKESCTINVTLTPKTDGTKQVQLAIGDSYSSLPTLVTARGIAIGFTPSAAQNAQNEVAQSSPSSKSKPDKVPELKTAPPKSENQLQAQPPQVTNAVARPPATPPDLLAIGFRSRGEIVSTGGLLWTMSTDGRWVLTAQKPGTQIQLGGMTWMMGGPATGQWATETRGRDIDQIRENDARDNSTLQLQKNGEGTELRRISSAGMTSLVVWPELQLRSLTIDPDAGAWTAGWSSDSQGDHSVLMKADGDLSRWQPLTRGALPRDRRQAAANGREWMWMPRWYLALLFVSLALAVPALLTPPEILPREEGDSVEPRLSSDKPLTPADRDVLGLTEIALGLSAFLRNEKTLPPLTIAVNGEWGTGKSSLMNLLWCDLKSYGWCPVWFNAWHHQKEEHLLAALLQTVKLEAVPPWNMLSVPFRVRLVAHRLKKKWPMLVLVSAATIFLVALDYHLRVYHSSDLFLWLTRHFLPSIDAKAAAPSSTLPVQGGLIALVTTIAALWKGLTAFGANPASLLASVAQGNKMKDLEAQTSFRQKFALEFREFTTALGQRRPLVIFIDDLDRCLPTNVRDVLEAVNFLVSSGDCFVVLGMDRVQVQRAVGLSFKEVAEEAGPKRVRDHNGPVVVSTPQAIAEAAAESARLKRAEFAQKYLEKLVNLEVRIPLAEDDTTKQGLFQYSQLVPEESLTEKLLRVGLRVLRWCVPAALATMLLWGAYHFSVAAAPAVEAWMTENQEPTIEANKTQSPSNANPATLPTESGGAATKPGSTSTTELKDSKNGGELIVPFGGPAPSVKDTKNAWPARWILSVPLYLAGLFLLLVTNVVLTTRPGVVTRDSKQFTDAMGQVWYPLVLAKQNTPRAAKRFVNRVRYLAMRQRVQRDKATWWERTLFPQRLVSPKRSQDATRIPEPVLVAMAALEQMDPEWIYDDKEFQEVLNGSALPPLAAAARNRHKQLFAESKNSQWSCLAQFRKTFLLIWPRVAPEDTEDEASMAASG